VFAIKRAYKNSSDDNLLNYYFYFKFRTKVENTSFWL
jgi:hypothetical protein